MLAEAGLPTNHFHRLTAESDAAVRQTADPNGTTYHRQSVRLVLQTLTPRELGMFLSVWSATQPLCSAATGRPVLLTPIPGVDWKR